MATVFPGYRGYADIAGVGEVRFADASITARQEVNAPDLIMGDWDHDAYVFGPIEVGGTISGPVTETFVCGSGGGTGLWNWGVVRNGTCGTLNEEDLTLYYYCGDAGSGYGSSRKFTGMLVNSLNFSCAAGDIAQFSIDVMGKSAGTWVESATIPALTFAEKLMTWDKCHVTLTAGADLWQPPVAIQFSNFDFTISNNLQVVYSLGQSNLFPYEIVPGLRTITGSISVYNIPESDGADRWGEYLAANVGKINFNIGPDPGDSSICSSPLEIDMAVRFHRVEPASSTGPIISSIGFTGVTHQTGTAWEA